MKRMVILAALGLAACADPHEPLSDDFGNSVRANIAAQVVNPSPNLTSEVTATDGERIANALHRYHTNTVYPPRSETATPFVNENSAGPIGAPPY